MAGIKSGERPPETYDNRFELDKRVEQVEQELDDQDIAFDETGCQRREKAEAKGVAVRVHIGNGTS